MKTWTLRVLLIAALGAGVFFAWRALFPNPEKAIRKRFKEIAEVASFAANEGPIAKVANSSKLASFFTKNVQIVIDVPGYSRQSFAGQEDLLRAAMSARSGLMSLKVEFPDVIISVLPDRKMATAEVTASAHLPGEREPSIQELKVTLVKEGSEWLVRRVETVKSLM
jgi:hypothetical protein